MNTNNYKQRRRKPAALRFIDKSILALVGFLQGVLTIAFFLSPAAYYFGHTGFAIRLYDWMRLPFWGFVAIHFAISMMATSKKLSSLYLPEKNALDGIRGKKAFKASVQADAVTEAQEETQKGWVSEEDIVVEPE